MVMMMISDNGGFRLVVLFQRPPQHFFAEQNCDGISCLICCSAFFFHFGHFFLACNVKGVDRVPKFHLQRFLRICCLGTPDEGVAMFSHVSFRFQRAILFVFDRSKEMKTAFRFDFVVIEVKLEWTNLWSIVEEML